MGITPGVMNAVQFWLVDNIFIYAKHAEPDKYAGANRVLVPSVPRCQRCQRELVMPHPDSLGEPPSFLEEIGCCSISTPRQTRTMPMCPVCDAQPPKPGKQTSPPL